MIQYDICYQIYYLTLCKMTLDSLNYFS